jgi:hypothetical protein
MVFGDPTKPARKRGWLARFLQRSGDSSDAIALGNPQANLGMRYEEGAYDRFSRQQEGRADHRDGH